MKTNNSIKIGTIVRYHREKAGLSRIAIARRAGVGKTLVFEIENDKQSVQWNTLNKVLRALNISVMFKSPLMRELKKSLGEKD